MRVPTKSREPGDLRVAQALSSPNGRHLISCPLRRSRVCPSLCSYGHVLMGMCSYGACAHAGMRSYGIALEPTLTQMRPVPAIAETWGVTAQTVKPPRLPSAKQIRQRWHDSQDFKP